ncbi:MAG: magnesium transporter [Pseudomonadota bacterium]
MNNADTPQTEVMRENYALNAAVVDAILAAVELGAKERLSELLAPLHEADIADLLEQISGTERRALVDLWGGDFDGSVLSELEEGTRDDVLQEIDDEVLADAVAELETDDVVYLVEDLEAEDQARLLDALDDADRVAVEASLNYGEDTAGRLMRREVVTAPQHWSVGEAIDFMRAEDDLPEAFYELVLIDARRAPVGQVPLGRLMAHRREVPLIDLIDEQMTVIPVDQSQDEVAYAFNQYHLISAPVVDDGGRLIGMITIDDAVIVLEEEAEEDMRRLAGVSAEEELSDTILETTRQRFPWLGVNLVTAVLASLVISIFEATIEAIVALAVLMPIVASMGGNAATQTLTVAVRALATKDLTAKNAWRVVRRETLVGLANGLLFAVIIAVVGYVWFGSVMLGVVLAMAMVVNLVVAGLAGILIPMGLDRAGADPALASGAFVTTVTDVVGFFAFLGLAAWLLI